MMSERGEGLMIIAFFCQSCGARFDGEPGLAGRIGRCKGCSHLMSVPRAKLTDLETVGVHAHEKFRCLTEVAANVD
jgi:hypothetical protein